MYYFKVTIGSIIAYFDYETVVGVRRIKEVQVEFPQVTICNLNAFDVGTDEFSGTYINRVLLKNNISPSITPTDSQSALDLVLTAANVIKSAIVADTNLTDASKQKIGFTMDTMLISCYFDGIKCNSSDFTWSHSYEYGNCYSFNAKIDENKNEKVARFTKKSGPKNGLNLELFLGAGGLQDYYLISSGVYVKVNNRSENPNVNFGGITVQTGVSSSIEIQREKYFNLPDPFSDCRKDLTIDTATDSRYFQLTSKLGSYTRLMCLEVYKQINHVISSCGCYHGAFFMIEIDSPICQSTEQIGK